MADELVYIDHGYYKEAVPVRQTMPRRAEKAMELPVVTSWEIGQPLWPTITWDRLKREGFNANAAFSACVTAYALALPEPPVLVSNAAGDPVGARHPLQRLLTRPNPYQSHNELMSLVATFLLVGGNAYLHKVRNGAGRVLELYPYHDGHFTPIPGRDRLIQAYRYDSGDGRYVDVPWEDIIHLKWPVADLDQLWRGIAPLRLLAKEVDTDNELSQIVWAVLKNSAIPSTLIIYPQGVTLQPEEREAIKQRYQIAHGGTARGGVGIATGGADVKRLSLSLEELDLSTVRRVPEARICAVCGIPAMLVGLTAGLERSTYSNMEEARKGWTQGTLMRLWNLIAGELEADLVPDFGADLTVAFDTSKVGALQPDMARLRADAALLYEKKIATRNESRAIVFLPPVGDIDVQDGGDVFADGSIPSKDKPEPPEPPRPIIEVLPNQPPPALTDDELSDEEVERVEKALIRRYVKARRQRATERTEQAMRRDVAAYLERQQAEALARD